MHLRFMGYMRYGITIIALGVGFFPFAVFAQLGQTPQDLSISVTPKYPGPFETVTASAVSYSFDLHRATYTWRQNGKIVSSGKDKTTFSFRTGAVGSRIDLELAAVPQSGGEFKALLPMRIGDITLVWSSDTYTPPGYRGKAIPTIGSAVHIIALPDFYVGGARLSSKTLYYDWEINNTPILQSSGRGADTLTIAMNASPGVPYKVVVTVSDEERRVTQQKRLDLVGREPSLLFYELDPLRGPIFQRAITKEFDLASGNEAQILAVPLFTRQSLVPQFTATWKIDGKVIGEAAGTRPLILRYTSQQGNAARQYVSLDLENKSNPLQALTGSFLINVQ